MLMNRLINYVLRAAIAIVILYMISFVLAAIVTVIFVIINRIIAYRKKHRRFTDWEYQFCKSEKKEVDGQLVIERKFIYERFDRVLQITERKEELTSTTLSNQSNIENSDFAEWLRYKAKEQALTDAKVRAYYSN